MLATLVAEAFSDPGWIYEPKLDGVRCLVFKKGSRVRLLSRNRNPIGSSFPELVQALAAQPAEEMILDGEIVAFRKRASSFARLQQRIHVRAPSEALMRKVRVYLYLFDVIHLEGRATESLPLRTRKRLLKTALDPQGPLRLVPHRNEHGEAYFEEVCRKPGWEGLIAKRADAPYVHGRSRDWLKFKCANQQELVIGGYTDPQGSRVGFGALLVGYYEDGRLRYAGKVGTGYDHELLRSLAKKLKTRERKTSPFADGVRAKNAHWVSPDLVGQFGFGEWTRDGRLRHPRFLGLRGDKDARDVVREEPA